MCRRRQRLPNTAGGYRCGSRPPVLKAGRDWRRQSRRTGDRGGQTTRCCLKVLGIYDLQGREVRREVLTEGVNEIELPAGIYIVNGQKVMIR